MEIRVFMMRQDDPAKCTAAKLVKFGLARQVRKMDLTTLVLDPYAQNTVLKSDQNLADSITAIDCSWELARNEFEKKFSGIPRKLPPLLAGNPVNFAKVGKLTTAESIAASLFIMRLEDKAHAILDKFKWGHTFFDLNRDLLADYANAGTEQEVMSLAGEYGLAHTTPG